MQIDELLKMYKENMEKHGCFSKEELPVSNFFNGMRLEVKPQIGQGWSELLGNENGICVSLCEYSLTNKIESEASCPKEIFQFSLMLSGFFDFQIASRHKQSVIAGDIWFSRGCNDVLFSQPSMQNLQGISLILPKQMVEAWLGESNCEITRTLESLFKPNYKESRGIFPIARSIQKNSRILQTAKNLFCADRSTLFGKLHFESLTLELLSQILSLQSDNKGSSQQKNNKIKTAVNEAVDILRQECTCAPTISGLARRVGVNECYLKSGFRKYTGFSIGEYVRKERMSKALELIESGNYSILETAHNVGYSNPSHFSLAFKRFYGHVPSYYARL